MVRPSSQGGKNHTLKTLNLPKIVPTDKFGQLQDLSMARLKDNMHTIQTASVLSWKTLVPSVFGEDLSSTSGSTMPLSDDSDEDIFGIKWDKNGFPVKSDQQEEQGEPSESCDLDSVDVASSAGSTFFVSQALKNNKKKDFNHVQILKKVIVGTEDDEDLSLPASEIHSKARRWHIAAADVQERKIAEKRRMAVTALPHEKPVHRPFNLFGWFDKHNIFTKISPLSLWREGVWGRTGQCIKCGGGVGPGYERRACISCPIVCHEECASNIEYSKAPYGIELVHFDTDVVAAAFVLWRKDENPTAKERRKMVDKLVQNRAWACDECRLILESFQSKFEARPIGVDADNWYHMVDCHSTPALSAMVRMKLRLRRIRFGVRLVTMVQARVRGYIVRRQFLEQRISTPWPWSIKVVNMRNHRPEHRLIHGYKTNRSVVPTSTRVIISILDDNRCGFGISPDGAITGYEQQLGCFMTGGGTPVEADIHLVDWGVTFRAPCTMPRTLLSLTVMQVDRGGTRPRFIGQGCVRLWDILQNTHADRTLEVPLGPLLHHPIISGINTTPGRGLQNTAWCQNPEARGGGGTLKIEISPCRQATTVCSFLWIFVVTAGALRPVKRWAVLIDKTLKLYLRPFEREPTERYDLSTPGMSVTDSVSSNQISRMGPCCGSPFLAITDNFGITTVLAPSIQTGTAAALSFQAAPFPQLSDCFVSPEVPLAPGLEERSNRDLMKNWYTKLCTAIGTPTADACAENSMLNSTLISTAGFGTGRLSSEGGQRGCSREKNAGQRTIRKNVLDSTGTKYVTDMVNSMNTCVKDSGKAGVRLSRSNIVSSICYNSPSNRVPGSEYRVMDTLTNNNIDSKNDVVECKSAAKRRQRTEKKIVRPPAHRTKLQRKPRLLHQKSMEDAHSRHVNVPLTKRSSSSVNGVLDYEYIGLPSLAPWESKESDIQFDSTLMKTVIS